MTLTYLFFFIKTWHLYKDNFGLIKSISDHDKAKFYVIYITIFSFALPSRHTVSGSATTKLLCAVHIKLLCASRSSILENKA